MINFDEANRKGKEAMDSALKNYSDVAKGFQAIAAEAGEYSKKSFQDMSSFVEALSGARSMDAVLELQSSYVKTSYEGFVAEASRIGEMYVDLAKAAYKPYEKPIAPVAKAAAPVAKAAA